MAPGTITSIITVKGIITIMAPTVDDTGEAVIAAIVDIDIHKYIRSLEPCLMKF